MTEAAARIPYTVRGMDVADATAEPPGSEEIDTSVSPAKKLSQNVVPPNESQCLTTDSVITYVCVPAVQTAQ